MTLQGRARQRFTLGFLFVALFGLAPSSAALQSEPIPAEAAAAARDAEDPAEWDFAVLPALEGAELLIWRAGRGRSAGVPAARVSRRNQERDLALEVLEMKLGDPGGGELWQVYLSQRVTAASGDDLADERWCRAARVVGRLELYGFAPLIVAELGPDSPAARRQTAREVLHGLYGRWFESGAEVVPYLDEIQPGPGTRLLLKALKQEEQRARELLLRALRADSRGALEALDHLDPLVRSGAALLLGESLGSVDEESDAILEALFERLQVEIDPAVYEALLEALLVPLENATTDDPRVVRLHGMLSVTAKGDLDGRSLPLARALSRLPLAEAELAQESGYWRAVEQIGAILGSLMRSSEERPEAETDAILGTLEAMRTVCDRARGLGIANELHQSRASSLVFGILQDPEEPEDVRIAAVGAVAPFTLREDWRLFTDVLLRPDTTPNLAHALLGVLPSILLAFEPDDPESPEVLARVATMTGASDPDLRRRALSLLGKPELEALVTVMPPVFLVERLAREEVPDLAAQLLDLIGRYGDASMLEPVLALERFDALAGVDAAHVSQLSATLKRLGAGRPAETFAAARRLAEVEHDSTRLVRLQRALGLVAELAPNAAQALGLDEHRLIGLWSWELHASGIALRNAIAGGDEFVRRLVELHLPSAALPEEGSEDVDGFGLGRRAHLLAVLAGESLLLGEDPTGADATAVEEGFALALGYAPEASDPSFREKVLRDRARFRVARGDHARALTDFRQLGELDALESTDLRSAVAVLAAIAETELADTPSTVVEKVDFLLRLLGRPSWTTDPVAQRMQDLELLVASVQELEDAARRRAICALFEDLPAAVPENGPESLEPRPFWSGLVQEPERLAELAALRERACAEPDPGPPVPAEQPQEEPPGEQEDPSEDGSGVGDVGADEKPGAERG